MAKETAALIPAAGFGTRLALGPKAFLSIAGTSLLRRLADTLSGRVDRILVGVPKNCVHKAGTELSGLAEVYPGGKSRQSTIFSLLQQCDEQIILICDVSRPFASADLFSKVIDAAKRHSAAAAFSPATIPVALYRDGFVTASIPAARVMLPQSPQAFSREILEKAYQNALLHGIEAQSTHELVLRLGMNVSIVPGEELNIKITTPLDWEIANKVIAPAVDSCDRHLQGERSL